MPLSDQTHTDYANQRNEEATAIATQYRIKPGNSLTPKEIQNHLLFAWKHHPVVREHVSLPAYSWGIAKLSAGTQGLVDMFRIAIDGVDEFTWFSTAGLEIPLDDVSIEDLLMVLNLDVETPVSPQYSAARSQYSYVGRLAIRPAPVTCILWRIDVGLW
jgi:hypothetical protein